MAEIKLEDVTYVYPKGNVTALKNVSISVSKGQIVSIIGANGAGKSTLLKTISGLVKPVNGSIEFENKELPKQPSKIVDLGVVHVPEGRKCFSGLTIKDNLLVGGYLSNPSENDKNLEKMFNLFPILKEREEQLKSKYKAMHQTERIKLLETERKNQEEILQKKIESKFMFDEAKMLDSSNFPVYKGSDGFIWEPFGYANKEFYPQKKFTLYEYSNFLTKMYRAEPKIYIYKKKLFNIIPQDVEYETNINLLAIKNKVECFFNDITCQYNIFYKKVMIPIFEESREILLETIALAEKLSKEFVFPLKYRKVDVVLKMIDLLESGNASTWKELVNAYDTYEYRESVKMSFEELNQKFDKVTNCLQNINNNLNDKLLSINNELSSISLKCSRMFSNTEKIKNSTFAIFWEQL